MLTKILVDGYKSIDHIELPLRGFTLFSGVNSAGKSSVIQAIRYMMELQGLQIANRMEELPDSILDFFGKCNDIKGNREFIFELSLCGLENDEYSVAARCGIQNGRNTIHLKGFDDQDRIKAYLKAHRVTYLSSERVGVKNYYLLAPQDSKNIDSQGEYAYSYFARYGQDELPEQAFIQDKEKIGTSLNNQVNYWLDYLLGFQMRGPIFDEAKLTVVKYTNSRSNHSYKPEDVGTGVTYISTLLIAALSCRKGDTLIIENPEIYLHPRAQSRFMECMAFLCGRGLQVILETHSDHIYNGMRKCIKKKMLSRDEIASYYFELDESMQTVIHEIKYNSMGAEENHPYGMFDQFDDDLDELIGM